jgi:hypothetical protein
MNNYIFTTYFGDTKLDIYGYTSKDEPSVGHVGGIEDIEDVCIADTQTSVLEMIHGLNWDKFESVIQQAYAESY